MEIVEERVFARLERVEHKERMALRRQHLFLVQLVAFEFRRGRTCVVEFEPELLLGWDLDAQRRDLAVVELDRLQATGPSNRPSKQMDINLDFMLFLRSWICFWVNCSRRLSCWERMPVLTFDVNELNPNK